MLLWLWVTVERRGERPAEKIVDATVTYNPPPGMMILDPQGTVRVRLRGRERAIRRVNPFQIDVQVVVRAEREGPLEVQLTPEDVMMPDGLEVVSIEPNVLRLNVDQEVRRLLPVDVPLVGEPAAGAQLAGKPARHAARGPGHRTAPAGERALQRARQPHQPRRPRLRLPGVGAARLAQPAGAAADAGGVGDHPDAASQTGGRGDADAAATWLAET